MFTDTPEPNMQPTVEKALVTSKIIWGALIAGVLSFFVVTLMIPAQPVGPQMAYIGLGFAVIAAGASFVVPAIATSAQMKALQRAPQSANDWQLLAIFQTRMIIGLAVLEAANFFNLICYMIERQWWSVAIVGGLVLLMVLKFPATQTFQTFADDTRRDLQNQF